MRVLYLGLEDSKLVSYLKETGHEVICSMERLSPGFIQTNNFEFLVSYKYRYIISNEILNHFPNKAINLHISLLPWNKGADPNLWSVLENTPKGVTIHFIDAGIDTGAILVQKEIELDDDETLSSSYIQLSNCIEQLFIDNWSAISSGAIRPRVSNEKGTSHKLKDKEKYLHLLTDGWNTKIKTIKGAALF